MKITKSRNQREGLFTGRTSRADERRYTGQSKRHYSRIAAENGGGLKNSRSAEFAHPESRDYDCGYDF